MEEHVFQSVSLLPLLAFAGDPNAVRVSGWA